MGFLVDTRAGCFMCLRPIKKTLGRNAGNNNNRSATSSSTSLPFTLLTRYLGVETGALFQALTLTPPPARVGEGVGVPLCRACGALAGEFSGLYQQLEGIRLQVEASVRKIHGVMEGAEVDQSGILMMRYRRRVLELNKSLEGRGDKEGEAEEYYLVSRLSEKLRAEVVLKCSSYLSKRSPRVKLDKLANNKNNTRNQHQRQRHLHQNPNAESSDAEEKGSKNCSDGDDDDDNNEAPADIKEEPVSDIESENESSVEPPSPSASTSTPDPPQQAVDVSFKKLRPDTYKCNLCFRVLRGFSLSNHRRKHAVGDRRFRCTRCPKTFRFRTHLGEHKYAEHRSSILSKYNKDPKLTSEQFERIVDELMDGLEIRRVGNRSYSCPYCTSVQQSRSRVRSHMLKHHLGELVPRLRVLLQKERSTESGQKTSGDGDTPSGTKTNLAKKRRRLTSSGDAIDAVMDHQDDDDIIVKTEKSSSESSDESSSEPVSPSAANDDDNDNYYEPCPSDDIPFKRLPSGKWECGLCSKALLQVSIRTHRLAHLSGVKSFQCHLCPKSFQHARSLGEHTYTDHRSSLFTQYKQPGIPSEQFEDILLKLFGSMPISAKSAEGLYSCGACGQYSQNRKPRVEHHIIRTHMESTLIPALDQLQKKWLQLETSPPEAN